MNSSLILFGSQVFGSTDLSDDQWKQLEDQRKMRAIFEMMQAKKAQHEALDRAGKVKYEYDSDEELDGTLGLILHVCLSFYCSHFMQLLIT